MRGWIYIVTNETYEGMYKIGFTDRDPDIRIDELYTTGVPTKFSKIYECLVENAYELEQKLHRELSEYRLVDNREFFKCDVQKIFDAIDSIKQRDKLNILLENKSANFVPPRINYDLPSDVRRDLMYEITKNPRYRWIRDK